LSIAGIGKVQLYYSPLCLKINFVGTSGFHHLLTVFENSSDFLNILIKDNSNYELSNLSEGLCFLLAKIYFSFYLLLILNQNIHYKHIFEILFNYLYKVLI
jgi:hypothetical protein